MKRFAKLLGRHAEPRKTRRDKFHRYAEWRRSSFTLPRAACPETVNHVSGIGFARNTIVVSIESRSVARFAAIDRGFACSTSLVAISKIDVVRSTGALCI